MFLKKSLLYRIYVISIFNHVYGVLLLFETKKTYAILVRSKKKHMLSWYALRKVEDTEEVARSC